MKYLSPEEIAALLGVSRATAYRIANECIHIRIGTKARLIRVPEDSLTRYLAQRTAEPESWGPSISASRAAEALL